jgi:hypothetical protein
LCVWLFCLACCLLVCLFVCSCIGTQSIASLAAPCPEVRGGGQMELVLYLSQSPLPPLPVLCLSGVFSGLVVFRSCCVVRPCAPCHAQARRALHKARFLLRHTGKHSRFDFTQTLPHATAKAKSFACLFVLFLVLLPGLLFDRCS